jgi:hypothetical protein
MMKCKQTIFSFKICRQSTKLFAGVLKALRAHTAKITQDWLKANMHGKPLVAGNLAFQHARL